MSTWVFEPGHTDAGFRARHMMVTWVRGLFKDIHGRLELDWGPRAGLHERDAVGGLGKGVIAGVTITATPGEHGVYEVTFALRAGKDAVYFAGDTMFIPELSEIPKRLGHISLALLPTNGLCPSVPQSPGRDERR